MKKLELIVTLIELGSQESPNIGTVVYGGDEVEFVEKIKTALESHFDEEVKFFRVQDGLTPLDVKNSPPLDAIVVLVGGSAHNIELQETWLY